MSTLIIVLTIVFFALLFIIILGKPINDWLDKKIKDSDKQLQDAINDKTCEIEKNLRKKYPKMKEIAEDCEFEEID